MNQETHILNMGFGIDFSKVLSEPYASGAMLTLGVSDRDNLIEFYAQHLHETILKAIDGREDVFLVHSSLSESKNDSELPDQSTEDSPYSPFEGLDFEEFEISPTTYGNKDQKQSMTDLVLSSLREISYMTNLKLSELHVKDGLDIDYDQLDLDQSVEIIKESEFSEDKNYSVEIPFKLILVDIETKEKTTILGGN